MTTTIAQNILDRLGGNKFLAMTGAVALAAEEDRSLTLKLPAMSKASALVIAYDASTDTYTIQQFRGRGLKMASHGEPIPVVFVDNLREAFTACTGMAVSL